MVLLADHTVRSSSTLNAVTLLTRTILESTGKVNNKQKKRINEISHERDNIRQNHYENYAWCYLTGGLFA